MAAYRSLRDLDWLMLFLVAALCGLGVLQIFSATYDTHYSDAWWKQVIWIAAGFIAMWIATLIDYHTLLGQTPLLYILSVVTLIATYPLGMSAFGSRRWIGTTSYHLQVSEFVKIVIVLLVARYVTELKTDQLQLSDLLKLGGLVGASHGVGDVAAGSGDRADVSSGFDGRCFSGGFSLAVRSGVVRDRCGSSSSELFLCAEGLSKSPPDQLHRS